MAFHHVRFPINIAMGARGGPQWSTDIVSLVSGAEERNTRWSRSRRKYNAGYGVKSATDLHQILAFFEERRGRFHGFFCFAIHWIFKRAKMPLRPSIKTLALAMAAKQVFNCPSNMAVPMTPIFVR